MKFWKELKRRWAVTVKGFKSIYYDYFWSNTVIEVHPHSTILHGNKEYVEFKYPIIAGGKVYSSIQELYDEDKAKKESKAKSNGNKRKTSRKTGKQA